MSLPTAFHLIDGDWRDSAAEHPVTDPGNDTVVGAVAWGGAAEAVQAIEAAGAAFESWSSTPARTRGRFLDTAADLLIERRERLGLILAHEAGKRLPEALGEIDFSIEYFRWFAEEARRSAGSILEPEATGRRHLVIHRPAGIAVSLTPWNFPVSIQARKLAPMLAAGCTVVARVSESTPLAATELVRALHDAGLPAGVLNLVHGSSREITTALVQHPRVRVVSFTGSTRVGSSIIEQCAPNVTRPLLELGGRAPFVVFDDADLDAAVEGAVLAKLRNTGQSCVAANHFIVHETVYDDFASRVAARFDAMTIGHGVPSQEGDVPDLGPMISHERVSAVQLLIDEAVAAGGTLLTSRTIVPTSGSFLAPALLANVPSSAALAREEVFGPIATIEPFLDEDEVLTRVNASPYGLASYVWTQQPRRVWRFAETVDAGIIGINDPLPSVAFAPMGGTKSSGLGREGAHVGMHEFQETHYVAWR